MGIKQLLLRHFNPHFHTQTNNKESISSVQTQVQHKKWGLNRRFLCISSPQKAKFDFFSTNKLTNWGLDRLFFSSLIPNFRKKAKIRPKRSGL